MFTLGTNCHCSIAGSTLRTKSACYHLHRTRDSPHFPQPKKKCMSSYTAILHKITRQCQQRKGRAGESQAEERSMITHIEHHMSNNLLQPEYRNANKQSKKAGALKQLDIKIDRFMAPT